MLFSSIFRLVIVDLCWEVVGGERVLLTTMFRKSLFFTLCCVFVVDFKSLRLMFFRSLVKVASLTMHIAIFFICKSLRTMKPVTNMYQFFDTMFWLFYMSVFLITNWELVFFFRTNSLQKYKDTPTNMWLKVWLEQKKANRDHWCCRWLFVGDKRCRKYCACNTRYRCSRNTHKYSATDKTWVWSKEQSFILMMVHILNRYYYNFFWV